MLSRAQWILSRFIVQLTLGLWLLVGMTIQVAAADVREPPDTALKSEVMVFVEADDEVLPEDVVKVSISKFKYKPAEITIEPGTVVLWINEDPMGHNAAFVAGNIDDVEQDLAGPIVGQGERFAVRFNESGRYDYYCTPHPFMKGVVIVE